ncbi:hypothetical protein FQ775_07120 [Nitratireductor mangrovi]|uniref:Uncharacterized protein n=1 Tax=Nitratireductor mangrovi TaxID=2599600 RepID=A0A5B8KX71_9HYPH|nr:hypothetical protein [Nitratireductor mangrovi]QDZ00171.1 hypothetical protein FQ775_07120 [Nitratireductor mangrovi]
MAAEPKITWMIASEVGDRDGIGVQLLIDGDLVLEIFRDDTKRSREVTLHRVEVPLELSEQTVAMFK